MSRDGRLVGLTDASEFASADYATIVRKTDGSPAVKMGDGWISDFTADGRWVVTVVPSTPPQLRLYPVGPGETRELDSGSFEALSDARVWGADADSVLACGTMSGHLPRCYLRTSAVGAWRPVTADGADHGQMSSDGHLLLSTWTDGSRHLVDLRTDIAQSLSGLHGDDEVIRWSPDGKSLWVWKPDTLPVSVDRVDIATGRRSHLTTFVPQMGKGVMRIVDVSLADDPRVYSYETIVQPSQLFVIEGAH
jgi:hypothetical protein